MPRRLSILGIALLLFLVPTILLAGTTERVSVDSIGLQAAGDSYFADISADGRYVAFYSLAGNLVPTSSNEVADVFVHDRDTGETAQVSVATDGTQGNDGSYLPAISADGRYVAFESDATNLVDSDTNSATDIFVHDRETGQTTRVSVSTGGAQGNYGSFLADISADGRYVAFESDATNLVSGDLNLSADVFVHDRQTGQTERVSVATDGTEGDWDSSAASISGNGRYVAFQSDAANLVAGDTNWWTDVFVRDRQTPATVRISVASDGSQADDGSYSPAISGDGRCVAFDSDATNLVSGDLNVSADVFVRDTQTNTTTRVSLASSGAEGTAHGLYLQPAISSDGLYVAYESDAADLVAGDTNGVRDIFLRDRQAGETTRVSLTSEDAQGNGESLGAAISADGLYVAFDSDASNLVPNDTNAAWDVFVRVISTATLSLSGSNGQVEVDGLARVLPWSGSFDYGASVTLEAIPDECWEFSSWSGDASGTDNPVIITMDANKSITAEFASTVIFTDVWCDYWAASEIHACYDAEIVGGYTDGSYRPSLTVDRGQMAVYVARALAGGDDSVPAGPDTPSFLDVTTEGEWSWLYDHVEYCAAPEQDVVKGYTDGTYRPALSINRGQMAAYIGRAIAGGDSFFDTYPLPATPTFPDVTPDGEWSWAYSYVEYISSEGVASGYTDGFYHPETAVTRDQMAVYVARAFELPM